jgi:hypothetical protein
VTDGPGTGVEPGAGASNPPGVPIPDQRTPLVPQPDEADPDVSGGSAVSGAPAELPKVLKIVTGIIAPASLITALLFYFGINHVYWYFRYFGVNYTVMDLTTQDFLLRSADALFVPVAAIVGLCLLVVWIYRLGSVRLRPESIVTVRKVGAVTAAVLGGIGIVIAMTALFNPTVLGSYLAIPGLCLAGGVVLIAVASRLQRALREEHGQPRLPEWVGLAEIGFLFLVVSGGLFWSVTNYSAAVGSARGFRTQLSLAAAPDVVLYSERSLSIPTASARESVCPQSDGAYRYRYTGLKLVVASSSQYFFLPAGWPGSGGLAIIIPRTDALRLEFIAPGLAQGASC